MRNEVMYRDIQCDVVREKFGITKQIALQLYPREAKEIWLGKRRFQASSVVPIATVSIAIRGVDLAINEAILPVDYSKNCLTNILIGGKIVKDTGRMVIRNGIHFPIVEVLI